MASLFHPRHPSGKVSRFWNLRCYRRQDHKTHYLTLKYPDGRRVVDRRDALRYKAEHEAVCAHLTTGPRTLSLLLQQYLDATNPARNPKDRYEYQLKATRLASYLGSLPITTLHPGHVEDALQRMVNDHPMKMSRRDHYLACLRQVAKWAVFRGYLLKDFTAGVKRLGTPGTRQYLPRDRWEDLLLMAAGHKYYPAVLVCLYTGLRRKELLSLEWRDINWATQQLHIRAEIAKTKREAYLALSDRLVAVLKPLEGRPHAKCFPFGAHAFQWRIKCWLEDLGYSGWGLGPHMLRHGHGDQVAKKYGRLEAQQNLRHKHSAMTDRYIHATPLTVEQVNQL